MSNTSFKTLYRCKIRKSRGHLKIFFSFTKFKFDKSNFYREKFGVHHPVYADALLDYGFYLLNVDSITAAVKVYQVSLL